MTIPWQHNCRHRPDGWCLVCVTLLSTEVEEQRLAVTEAAETIRRLSTIRPCPHETEGWCLQCVGSLGRRLDVYRQALADLLAEIQNLADKSPPTA